MALFFGLSGTSKTTLSVDPARALVGDDGTAAAKRTCSTWGGGCYAKAIVKHMALNLVRARTDKHSLRVR